MDVKEIRKPHWDRLIRKLQEYCNGQITLDFQNGLPIKIVSIEGKDRNIDLTKDFTKEPERGEET